MKSKLKWRATDEAPLREQIARAPGDLELRLRLARMMTAFRRNGEAVAAYEAALAIDPDCVPVLVRLGAMLPSHERIDEARAMLSRAVALEPGNAAAVTEFGEFLWRYVSKGRALKAVEDGLVHCPDSATLQFSHGLMLAREGLYEEALAAFRRAAALDPNWPAPRLEIVALRRRKPRAEPA